MTKTEGNIIIAKFMGWELDDTFPDKGRTYRKGSCIEMDTTFKYHESWELLFQVKEKIEAIRDIDYGWFAVTIRSNTCSIDSKYLQESIAGKDYKAYMSDPNAIFKTCMESTWYNLVEFIKWYNEN